MARLGSVPAPLGARVPSSASAVPATTVASRHSALVRVTHWITALCFFALLVSGFEIVISHPRFYWGETGNVLTTPLFQLPIPSSRSTVPTGYGYVLPDQNGWSRYLHFEAAWMVVLTGLLYVISVVLSRAFAKKLAPGPCRSFVAGFIGRNRSPFTLRAAGRGGSQVVQRAPAAHLPLRHFRSLPAGNLDGSGHVPRLCFRVSGRCHHAGRPAIRAHHSFLRLAVSSAVPAGPRGDGLHCRIQKPHARDDHGPRRRP